MKSFSVWDYYSVCSIFCLVHSGPKAKRKVLWNVYIGVLVLEEMDLLLVYI